GPMIWSPDSSALIGPVPELENYYCCTGIIPGFSQSGGLGLTLAQWIIHGEPEMDLFPWDLARFGSWADKSFTRERAMDQYANRFKIHFPYEEREAGRPVKTRPVYQLQKQLGAVFGLSFGYEHPLWFAGAGVEAKEDYGFERQAWFDVVAEECEALRTAVGVIDVSNFAKYEIKGEGSADWLDRLVANHIPAEIGRSCLTPMLGVRGGIAGDFTITKLADEHFLMIGSGIAERYHQRFFKAVPRQASVSFESLTENWAGFNVAGPNARRLLGELTDADLCSESFKFMCSQRLQVAGLDAIAIR
ncbi:MAG: FAD-dependent oxidoreductase, partial [Gammaproteobacteria bacterium]|nr:FAD-dependent oxidoreductase [Gammaproteobacteria bacterium]